MNPYILMLCGLLAVGACRPTDAVSVPPGARSALFIGNSYLYTKNVPGIVKAFALASGEETVHVHMVAYPNYALIDHWVEGDAVRAVRSANWTWVVLQQGPSSVGVNRDTLRLAARLFDGEVKKRGGRVAMFSAWPTIDRRVDFPRAIESYALAASDVGGIMLPIASAWLAAWDRDPTVQLYEDGLHPSEEGAYLAALVIYARLLEKSPRGLPHSVHLDDGTTLTVTAVRAELLQGAAASVTGFP